MSVVCGALLFGAESFLKKLGLDLFMADYRKYIGVAFIGVNVLLFSHVFSYSYEHVRKKINNRRYLKKCKERLHSLTPQEKSILSGYVFNNTRSQDFECTDGVVLGLEEAKIIYRASDLSSFFTDFPYIIRSWAWDYLKENPDLLK